MKQSWTQGLSEEDKQHIRDKFNNAVLIRERLGLITQEKIESSLKESRSKVGMGNPNWTHKQAFHRGYESALEEILELIEVKVNKQVEI